MRSIMAASALALTLSACASQTPTPPTASNSAETKASAPAKAPQCWNGDAARFENVGVQTKISGVTVVCEKTTDGKNAQWMGVKK